MIRLLVNIVTGLIRTSNKYSDLKAANDVKKIRSGKVSLEDLKEELIIIQGRKTIGDEQNFYTTGAIEKKFAPLLGKEILKSKKLDFFNIIDDQHIVIVVKATVVDDYKFDEFYNYILKLDKQKREVILYSDSYADARMKFSKAEVTNYLLKML